MKRSISAIPTISTARFITIGLTLTKKFSTGARIPDENFDLLKVAQSVGMPTRQNCGSYHFDRGGANGMKHSDLDNSLIKASREPDVQMGRLDFRCTECHITIKHQIRGASHCSIAHGVNYFG